jgi:hypothetical protein
MRWSVWYYSVPSVKRALEIATQAGVSKRELFTRVSIFRPSWIKVRAQTTTRPYAMQLDWLITAPSLVNPGNSLNRTIDVAATSAVCALLHRM